MNIGIVACKCRVKRTIYLSVYRIEGTHNMAGFEHSTANFLVGKQLNEAEVYIYV